MVGGQEGGQGQNREGDREAIGQTVQEEVGTSGQEGVGEDGEMAGGTVWEEMQGRGRRED